MNTDISPWNYQVGQYTTSKSTVFQETGFHEHAKLCRNSSSIHASKNMAIPCRSLGNVMELNKAEITKRGVRKSLAIANALELLKLFFLSSSLGSEVQAALRATFQLYSESEIFTALSFLRDKNFMVSMCYFFVNISFSSIYFFPKLYPSLMF